MRHKTAKSHHFINLARHRNGKRDSVIEIQRDGMITRQGLARVYEKVRDDKIRANCKFSPWDTKVPIPAYMRGYRKFCLISTRGRPDSCWQVAENMVPIDYVTKFKDAHAVGRCVIFAIPPQSNMRRDVAFYAALPDLDFEPVVTMNKKQREKFNEGIQRVRNEDDAIKDRFEYGLKHLSVVMLLA